MKESVGTKDKPGLYNEKEVGIIFRALNTALDSTGKDKRLNALDGANLLRAVTNHLVTSKAKPGRDIDFQ